MHILKWDILKNTKNNHIERMKETSLVLTDKRGFFSGTPDWIRTSGLQSRSLSLYPTELRARILLLPKMPLSITIPAAFGTRIIIPTFRVEVKGKFFQKRLLKKLTTVYACVTIVENFYG